MIVCFNTNDPPRKMNIENGINSKIIISDYMTNHMVSNNNLTSFLEKEDAV